MGEDIIRLTQYNNAISGRHLLCQQINGDLPAQGTAKLPINDKGQHPNRVIDWNGSGAYLQKLHQSHKLMISKLDGDGTIGKLLAKPDWTKEDRDKWEKKLYHTAHSILEHEEFYIYRTALEDRTNKKLVKASMNELTPFSEFGCVEKSATALALVQSAEFHFLKGKGSKEPSNYYMVVGKFKDRHAFIVSEKTVNLFDTTNEYILSPSQPISFSQFIKNGSAKFGSHIYSTGRDTSPELSKPLEVNSPITAPPAYINNNHGKKKPTLYLE